MKRNWFLTSLLFALVPVVSAIAQTDSTAQAREDARIWAEVRKALFKSTRDDSSFVANNSDTLSGMSTILKQINWDFLESMFFSSKPGEVIGPLFLDEYAMLFKVIEYDTLYRVRASHLYLKPDGKSRKDTLNAIKKANKYLKEIQEGANFEEMAKKYSQDETAAQGGDLGWLWQGMTIKEFDQVLANGKKGDIVVIKSALGAHIVKITEDKVYDRGRVKVVPLMRKI